VSVPGGVRRYYEWLWGKEGGLMSGHRGWLVFLSGPREVGGVL